MENIRGSGFHILLIEDNPGDEMLLKDVLSRSRFNTSCDSVDNGEDALNYLYKRGEYTSVPEPDLVLMDLTLPHLDGMEVLKIIKNDPTLKLKPVVIFTGSDSPDDIRMAYDTGANGYITKPIGYKQLEDKIRSLEEFWFGSTHIPSRL